jgi:hypothetical protein
MATAAIDTLRNLSEIELGALSLDRPRLLDAIQATLVEALEELHWVTVIPDVAALAVPAPDDNEAEERSAAIARELKRRNRKARA